ncbi:MAG: glycosyltransferase [Acidobacteriaceae bacterium]|nr:glycosyltransferase [Acidobacteriaceae bacterium]
MRSMETAESLPRADYDPQVNRNTLVSILVPLFNEETFIAECLGRILRAPLPSGTEMEIVVVDDGSTDGSVQEVLGVQERHPGLIRLVRHPQNMGKGAAIHTALSHASGEFSIIQDADLEYSPKDYPRLLEPLLSGDADAVFGSRFLVTSHRRVLYFWHSVANQLLTLICDMLADVNLSDMETCYKAFRTSLVKSIPLRCKRFGIEPELTIKLAQRHARMYETSVSYYGRTYEEGKKIGLKDAIQALLIIARFGLFQRDVYRDPGPEMLDVLAAAPHFHRWMADTVSPYLGDRVMEIGAGIGNLTRVLSGGRKRYIASDIDAEHLVLLKAKALQRHNFEAIYADLEYPEHFAPYRGSLDSVVCLNVLEHIRDDALALANIFDTLRPGGTAVILVPEGMQVFGTLDELLGHQRRYSEAELRRKLEAAGFKVHRILPFNRVTRPGWYVNGRLLKRRKLGRFQVWIFDRLVWLWRRIDGLLPWNPTSLIAVAIRPH